MIVDKIHSILKWIAGLSVIGMVDAAYLTYLHFEPTASEFCNFGDAWRCDIVNKSEWSFIDLGFIELPVSIMGFGTYLLFFIVAVLMVKKFRFQKIHKSLRDGVMLKLMRYLSVVGVVFSLYLTYIEAFKLMTFCLFCVISQVTIIIIMVLFFWMNSIIQKNKKDAKVCEFC